MKSSFCNILFMAMFIVTTTVGCTTEPLYQSKEEIISKLNQKIGKTFDEIRLPKSMLKKIYENEIIIGYQVFIPDREYKREWCWPIYYVDKNTNKIIEWKINEPLEECKRIKLRRAGA